MKTSLNVIIATAGRDTLQKMIDSVAPQLEEQDYLTIIWDCQPIALQIDSKCQVISLQNPEPLGFWGHGSRNKWQDELPGDYFMNADDDDVYAPNAIREIRKHCIAKKLYVFKFYYNGRVIPNEPKIYVGNIGTSCGVYPKVDKFPKWQHEYGGDGMFYVELSKLLPVEFVDKIIYIVRPHEFKHVIPDDPKSMMCDCGRAVPTTFNKLMNRYEGYCNRCDRLIK